MRHRTDLMDAFGQTLMPDYRREVNNPSRVNGLQIWSVTCSIQVERSVERSKGHDPLEALDGFRLGEPIIMNAATYKIAWTAAAAALVIVMLGMAPRISAAQAGHLTHKEVVQLIVNAKEPQDHLRIAEYYKDEAAKLEEEAKYHEAMRESYRKAQPAPHASPTQTVAHCDVFIKDLREAAEQDKQLAAEHEQMAKDAVQPAK